MSKKLHSLARRQILALFFGRCFYVDQLRAEGVVERIGAECAGMDWTRNEFPERLEILKCRLVRVVVMGRGIVHIRRDPDGVAYAGPLDEREQVGNFQLASAR